MRIFTHRAEIPGTHHRRKWHPDKTSAIRQMKPPEKMSRSFEDSRGWSTNWESFHQILPHSQPLRELLSKESTWIWGPSQEQAFARVKEELSQPTVLTLYDPEKEYKISANASTCGLGAVLLQKTDSNWKPVAYASRSMSETER